MNNDIFLNSVSESNLEQRTQNKELAITNERKQKVPILFSNQTTINILQNDLSMLQ